MVVIGPLVFGGSETGCNGFNSRQICSVNLETGSPNCNAAQKANICANTIVSLYSGHMEFIYLKINVKLGISSQQNIKGAHGIVAVSSQFVASFFECSFCIELVNMTASYDMLC